MADEEKKDVPTETSEDKKEKAEVPEKFKSLVESIEQLSVLDLSELVKVLEEKFGVSAAAPVAVAAVPAENDEDGGGEAKSSFNVMLTGIGDKKIEVIKAMRDATGQGLKEAKDLVDAAVSSPQMIKEGANKEEADELKSKFETAGATVELQ